MKKYLLIVLLLSTLVLFAGCQNEPTEQPSTEVSDTTDDTLATEQQPVTEKVAVVEILDIAERDNIPCAEALQGFYSDEEYDYYYSCIKSEYVIVKYSDNTEKTVEAALKAGDITIEDLDKYGIEYYKEAK